MKKGPSQMSGEPIPKYIREANVVGAPLTYDWNDENHESYWRRSIPPLERKLSKIAERSVIALAAATGEWVAWRLTQHLEDCSLFKCIEAVYASTVDWKYFKPAPNPFKVRKGATQRPMDVAIYLLDEAIDRANSDEYVADIPVLLSNLAEHLLPESIKPFRKWRNDIIARLQRIEPFDLDNPWGNPVPKEAMDPDFMFKASMAKNLIGTFLRSLDYRKNPFLNPPEKMVKLGFDGTPYRF